MSQDQGPGDSRTELRALAEQLTAAEQLNAALRAQLTERELEVAELAERDRQREQLLGTLLGELSSIKSSAGWGLLQALVQARFLVAPRSSRRERLLRRLSRRASPSETAADGTSFTPARQPAASLPGHTPTLSLLLPVDQRGEALERTIDSVVTQDYSSWELWLSPTMASNAATRQACLALSASDARIRLAPSAIASGSAAALNAALGEASGEYVGALWPGDKLAASGLARLAAGLVLHDRPDVLYSDESLADDAGNSIEPVLKPGWSPELALAFPYFGRCCLIRRELALALGGWREDTVASDEYDLVLRAAAGGARIVHLSGTHYLRGERSLGEIQPYSTPAALAARRSALEAYLEAIGLPADIVEVPAPARLRVRCRIAGRPLVSVIIPTRDRVDLLRRCIESVESRTEYDRYELIVVDNDSTDPATLDYLASFGHRVVPAPGPFNFAAINNLGARAARGEHLVLLNNDTEVIAGEWMTAMLEWSQQPSIGCVGAKLLFGDRRLQHVGVILHDGLAHHPFYGQAEGDGNHWLETALVRNFSAVTAACLMIRREVFEQVGGLDESFPANYNDVDLCLKVLAKGFRNIFTPYALLYHHESSSRGPGIVIEDDRLNLQRRRGQILWNDPYWPRYSAAAARSARP